MADHADLYSTFESGFFKAACGDVLRIVSILSLDSTDVTKPRRKNPTSKNAYEKMVFFWRFFYMVFIKGFTPTVFELLPYWFWRLITMIIYIYRLVVVPFWLRFTGYTKFASWKDIGKYQPVKDAPEAQLHKPLSLTKETNLANVDFGDPLYEMFITKLYSLTTHLSPHSQSPGNPFGTAGFPGNFFDHLTGVYKVLLAWKQPIYVARAGLFHSLYGTFDYRFSIYDLRKGRDPLRSVIGAGAEELAFAICTSDRIGLTRDLVRAMYGSAAKDLFSSATGVDGAIENPKLVGILGPEGFPVKNHITQSVHVMNPDLFAQYCMVMIADFMEQGVDPSNHPFADVTLFQFQTYRYFNDLIRFIKPYLRASPPVWDKYMGASDFREPNRTEIVAFKNLYCLLLKSFDALNHKSTGSNSSVNGFVYEAYSADELALVTDMTRKYPYLMEPHLALAAMTIPVNDSSQAKRVALAVRAEELLSEWGLLCVKSAGTHGIKVVLKLAHSIQKQTP